MPEVRFHFDVTLALLSVVACYLLLASFYLWSWTPVLWPAFSKCWVATAVIYSIGFVRLCFFLKSSSHLFTNALCTYTVLSLHKIHCYVCSYLFLGPANAVYLFKKCSISLTVALHFPFISERRLVLVTYSKIKIIPAASTRTDCTWGQCKVRDTLFTISESLSSQINLLYREEEKPSPHAPFLGGTQTSCIAWLWLNKPNPLLLLSALSSG